MQLDWKPTLAQDLQLQLSDASSPFRTGAFAPFASHIAQLSGVLPSPHSLWTPGSPGPRDAEEAICLDPVAEGLSKLNELADVGAHSDDEEHEEDVVKRPEYWGLRVRDLSEFHTAIRDELVGYCEDHRMRFQHGQCVHVCKHGDTCPWGDHAGVLHDKTCKSAETSGQPLLPNMHAALGLHLFLNP